MKAIILCAGKGERLKPLTETIPKPMVPINNKPVLEYLIRLCKKHNITEIAINTSYFPEKIKEYFGNGSRFGVKIFYSFEPELLGTSGALNNFKNFLNETFFVIYGDNVSDIDLEKFMQYHKEKKGIATIALRKKPKNKPPSSFVSVDESFKIKEFIEKPSLELFEQICKDFYLSNSGLYVLEPEIFNYIQEGYSDFAYDIFPKLIESGKEIFTFMMDDYYFREVGKIDKYELVKDEIESGKIKLDFMPSIAIFLDRDGTINENLYEPDGKIMSPANLSQLKIISNVKEGIKEFRNMGFKVIGITNQPGVAFGYLLPEKLTEINNFLKKELEIDEIYSCIHSPKEECECRKPKTGLILKAADDLDIDISNSYIIGDSLSDIKTGQNAGVKKTFLIGIIREDILNIQHEKGIFPDFTLQNLIEVAEKIKELENKN